MKTKLNTDGIILDIDGTIWNTTPIVAEAWNHAIKSICPMVPLVTAEILQGQFGKPMNVIADNLFKGITQEERELLLDACCRLEQKAITENKTDITYPGVIKGIKTLAEKYRLFIVSNCQDGYIELTMHKNGIESYITDFECYGRTGKGKADNIRLVVERNNLKAPVYVGDTEGDLTASEEAGVPFVWASYGFGKNLSESRVSAVLTKFEDLLSITD